MVPNRNGAVTSAVLVHLPTRGTGPLRLALAGATRSGSAGVGSLARDPLARLCRIHVESTGTTINFRPAAITHRDIAASALLIAFRRARCATCLCGVSCTRKPPARAWQFGKSGPWALPSAPAQQRSSLPHHHRRHGEIADNRERQHRHRHPNPVLRLRPHGFHPRSRSHPNVTRGEGNSSVLVALRRS